MDAKMLRCFIILMIFILNNDALVQSPPQIVKQPPTDEILFKVAYRALENEIPFIIECEAEGEPSPKYSWIKNGKKFDWQAYDDRISQQPGRGTLVIASPRDEDLGQYQCFAENEWGIATSNSVFVRKAEFNAFKDMTRKKIEAHEGEPFKLTCEPPDGWPKPSIVWVIESTTGSVRTINDSRMTLDPEGNLWFTNIMRKDNSDGFRYTCAATSSYRNEYKLGNRILLRVIPSRSITSQNMHQLTQQYVTRRNEVAFRGSEANLYCIYGGTPLPQIIWQKNGTTLESSDRISQQNYGRSIKIKHVSYADKGEYTCIVTNGVGEGTTNSISLDILAVPYFTVEPESKIAAEDETVEIRCEASGIPEPQIKWIHNGKPIAEAPVNTRRIVTSNSIVIEKLVKKDTGNYGCNATNSHGYVYKDVYINVLALKLEIIEPPFPQTISVNGRDVILRCRVFGVPKPSVKWIRGGIELAGGRYSIQDNGDLQIKNVSISDANTYTCHASNKLGEATSIGQLSVKERTRITWLPEMFQVSAGQNAFFRCNAEADADLTLKIHWKHNGKFIDFDSEPRFHQSADFSLTITKTTELDSGEYTCVARTELDEESAQAELVVQDVPNPPVIDEFKCTSPISTIAWHSMGDNNAPIYHYKIEYNTSFTPDTWDIAYSNIPATDLKSSVNLSPWVNYTFRISAENRIGFSLPSRHSEVCTSQPDIPYKNPEKVEGMGSDPTNLLISWTRMPEIDHNGPGFFYRIYYKRDIPGEDWVSEDVYDWRKSQLLIRDQPTFKPYRIKVVAMNEKGESNVTPVEVIGFSGEDSPLEAPGNFTLVQVISSTSAILSWNPVSLESVRGHLKGYKIQTWTDKGGESNSREVFSLSDTNKALVTNFVPHSKNYARILAYNGRFNGPPSNTLSFDTPEGVPGTVQAFNAYQMGSSALFLTWKKPEQPNGNLIGYRIAYQELKGIDLGPRIELPKIHYGNQIRKKLAGLHPNTKYRLTISATTRAGVGEEYFIEQRTGTGAALIPDIPDFRINIIRTVPSDELSNIRVTWLPNLSGKLGSHFYVKYRLKGDTSFETSKPEMDDHFTLISGLNTGVYEIQLVAIDGEHFTESRVQEIDTSRIDAVSTSINNHTVVSSRGFPGVSENPLLKKLTFPKPFLICYHF